MTDIDKGGEVKPMNRFDLQKVSSVFQDKENAITGEVHDIERQIQMLQADKAKKERDAFVAGVKGRALREAIRYLEDHDIV